MKKIIPLFGYSLSVFKGISIQFLRGCMEFFNPPPQLPLKNVKRLHLNGCGDFTLLSREDWQKLRGYPEWEMFSWHLDSVLLVQAHLSGIKEIDLNRRLSIYHIEHGIGSGYTPEGVDLLFKRLDDTGVKYLSYADFLRIVKKMKSAKAPILYNPDNWGLSHLNFEEILV